MNDDPISVLMVVIWTMSTISSIILCVVGVILIRIAINILREARQATPVDPWMRGYTVPVPEVEERI